MTNVDGATLLGNVVAGLVPIGAGRWKVPVARGIKKYVGIRIHSQWATFRCAMPHVLDELPFTPIVRQSAWPGGAKLVGAGARLSLRAEVPLLTQTAADRDWLSRQFREAIRGLQTAAGHAVHDDVREPEGCRDTDPEMLAERCRAAGWHAVVKADGEVRVNVESRSVPRVVSVERHGQTLRATVALGNGGLAQAGDESLQAAAHFLLRASSSLRFARAWASGSADAPGETGFECWFCPATGDAPLVTAIDALTTACDRFGAEVEALIGSTAVARQYLQTFAPGRAGVAKPAAYRRAAPANGSSPFDASEAVLV